MLNKLKSTDKTYVYIDFETYGVLDIRAVGAYKYLNHEKTGWHCLSFAIGSKFPVLLTPEDFTANMPAVNKLRELAADPNVIFIAHNAYFDRMCWQFFMDDALGLHAIPIERWQCTMAKAYSYGLPGALKDVAAALSLTNQKDMAGRESMLFLAKPKTSRQQKLTGSEFWTYAEKPTEFDNMYSYCKQDVETMREFDVSLRDLPEREQRIWCLDQRINEIGITVDLPLVQTALKWIEIEKERDLLAFQDAINCATDPNFSEIPDYPVSKDAPEKPTQRAKLIAWLKTKGVEVDNTQKGTIEALLESGGLPADVQTALELCISGGKAAIAKYNAMFVRQVDSVVREILVYHKAHTGRWGGYGIQIQNFIRPTMDVDLVCLGMATLSYESFCMVYGDAA